MVAYPAPFMDMFPPGGRLIGPLCAGSDRLYVPLLTEPEILRMTKVALRSVLQKTCKSS